jgi:hypothetical protein
MFKKKPTRKELENEIGILKDKLSDLEYITLTKNRSNKCDYNKIMCSNCKHPIYGKIDGVRDKFICDINIECENFDKIDTNDCCITINNSPTTDIRSI